MSKIKLGDRVRDPITGYEGIAIGLTEWLYGCTTVTVKPEKLKDDGTPPDNHSFDEPQLVLLGRSAVASKDDEPEDSPRRRTGGPRDEPMRPNR